MQYNSMYFKLRNYKKNSLINIQIPLKLNPLRNNHLLSFQCDITVNMHKVSKKGGHHSPYPSARQCETAFTL